MVAAAEVAQVVEDAQQRVVETVIPNVLAVMVVVVVVEPVLVVVLKIVRADAEQVLVLKLVDLDAEEVVRLTVQGDVQQDAKDADRLVAQDALENAQPVVIVIVVDLA